MSVNWDSSKCAAYIEAHKFSSDSKEWRDYVDLRDSLIWALVAIGFPPKSEWAINKKNWRKVYARLFFFEKCTDAYRQFNNAPDMFFSPEEVQSMIGLSVNAGNKTDAEFRKHCFTLMGRDVESALRNYDRRVADVSDKDSS